MTGEVTLRGRVLPIGGLREKTMAALRNGIHKVILPAENQKDIEEIDPAVREKLEFYPVRHVDEVLGLALRPVPQTAAPSETQEAPELADLPEAPMGYEAEHHVPLQQ